MSNRVRNGRIGKRKSPEKKHNPNLTQLYFFKPTADNRRLRPFNKTPYKLDFSVHQGLTLDEVACRRVGGPEFIIWDILGGTFDLASRPDLVIALRSLPHIWYIDENFMNIDRGLARRGFKKEIIPGSHYKISWRSDPSQVKLSADKTPFDHFIEMKSPHDVEDWTMRQEEVSFNAEPLATLLPRAANTEQGRAWDVYPIRLSFYGVPVRLERLFIDDPEKKATYLTISPAGITTSPSGHPLRRQRCFLYVTMKLDEEGKEEGWAEKMLGLPFHFSGALYSTDTVDLVETRFEKVDDEAVIKKGLRFELRGTVDSIDEAKITVKPDWLDRRALENEDNRETMHVILQKDVEVPVVGEKYLIKGIIPPPVHDQWGSRFDLEDGKLPDGVWKAFAFDRIIE
ncbi:hypothetical protein J4E80_006783 [Alternaria sp. BMP 0032]|nr:hypothetical protein J4E80_006783 [Alternaria sp. BMP 0032]